MHMLKIVCRLVLPFVSMLPYFYRKSFHDSFDHLSHLVAKAFFSTQINTWFVELANSASTSKTKGVLALC